MSAGLSYFVNADFLEPRFMVCNDCLKIRPYSQAGHEGEFSCQCGGDFCGCSFCIDSVMGSENAHD